MLLSSTHCRFRENLFKGKFMKIYTIYLSKSGQCKAKQDLGLSQ